MFDILYRLGRYGDPQNPYGDLESIAKVECMLKPGGYFFLGLSVGRDCLAWNAHRIYGPHRLPLALANWEVIDVLGTPLHANMELGDWSVQPVFVLKKRM
jgi:hypothetical protein